MNLSKLLNVGLVATLLGSTFPASAGFNFGSPFDMWDNNDDYRSYDRGGRGYSNNDRWQRYDEWEPNYWRYRYFDDDSRDYVFDDYGFDNFDNNGFSDGFGDGRGRLNFGMEFDMDSGYDGDYRNDFGNNFRNDFRNSGRSQDNRGYPEDRYDRYDNRGYPEDRYDRYDNRSAPRYDSREQYRNDDQYNDDYWREYSRRSGNSGRRAPDYPQRRR
jgi:hypothetical protein